MSNEGYEAKKTGGAKGKPGDLAMDVARLAEETGLDTSEVYAFLCGGSVGTGSGSEWLDKAVSDDVKKHLRSL